MLWRSSEMMGRGIQATDGSIGSVSDLLFDDRHWTLRWLMVDTGGWLPGRRVLIAPEAVREPVSEADALPVSLTRQAVQDSPSMGEDLAVSQQHQADLYTYYGWEPYWGGYMAPFAMAPVAPPPRAAAPPEPESEQGDPHLRSAREITGYYIEATDEPIGHVEEFLLEPGPWRIRYMTVDTKNWWPGRKVLVAPDWIKSVSWHDQVVRVGLTRDQVKESPEYNPQATIDRAYEDRLHRHYGFRPYWP